MRALFISDLHLSATDHETTARFSRVLRGPARSVNQLVLLGDVFDAWIGDDQLEHDPFARAIAAEIAALCAAGISVSVLGGNRDFLLGERFVNTCGATLLPSQIVLVFGTQRVLLLHGDELCSDDFDYQKLRATMTRNSEWCAQFLAQPFAARSAIALKLRTESEMAKGGKSAEIMDVNADAVADAFARSGTSLMIHGHTHRPATHTHHVNGRTCTRIVLSDWQHGHGYLLWANGAFATHPWP